MRLIIFVICFLFSGSVISQTKLSQLERSSNKWDIPIAYRNVNGTYAQGYLSFLNFIDSINYNAVRVLIPGYGISGLITNDTLALWADTTEVQRKLTLTTSGTSGAATLVGGTLNIPNYSGGSGITGTGTQYKVPRWLTSSSLENSATPLWDYNGIVGIGQTGTGDFSTNTRILQVYQPANQLMAQFKATSTNAVSHRFENGSTGYWNIGLYNSQGVNEWNLRRNESQILRILSTGQHVIPYYGTGTTKMAVFSPNGFLNLMDLPASGGNTDLYYTQSGTSIAINTTSQLGSPVYLNPGSNISFTYTNANNISVNSTAGGMNNWLLAASGTAGTQTISNGNTVTISAGSGITATRSGSTVTIAATGGGGGTDLSFSGTNSPYTLNSSTGTDVTFTAGTGIGLSATSGNITISNTGSGGSLPAGTQNQTLRHNGTTWVANSAVQIINVGNTTERAQVGSTTFPLALNAGTGTAGTRLAVSGGIQFVPTINAATGLAGMDGNNALARVTIGQGLTLTGNTLTASNGATLYNNLSLSSTNNTTTVDAKFNFTAQGAVPVTGSPLASSTNDNLTIQTSGVYEITFTANMKAASVASAHNVFVRINSSNQLTSKRTINSTQYGSVSISLIQSLNVNDIIDVWIDLTSTTVEYDAGFILVKKIN